MMAIENGDRNVTIKVVIEDPVEIGQFFAALDLESVKRNSGTVCACRGTQHVQLFKGDSKTTGFTIHHETSIRWAEVAPFDIPLSDHSSKRLAEFLDQSGPKIPTAQISD